MNRRKLSAFLYFLAGTVLVTGCQPRQPIYFREGTNLSQYLDRATQVDYPDVQAESLDEVEQNDAPVTLRSPEFGEYWELSLEDAIAIALQNSKVIRGYGTPGLQGNLVAAGADTLANNPAGAGTTYNVAIRETEPGSFAVPGQLTNSSFLPTNSALEGLQGVEAALAEFDTHFSSSMTLDKTDQPRNTIAANPFAPPVFVQNAVNFQAQLAKKAATGTQFYFRNVTSYQRNNNPPFFQPLSSWYTQRLEAEARQPLLRGRGTFVNRMPIIIARIGADQEIANLETQLQNMVCNVEIRYWNLYGAYRNYEAAKAGEDAALGSWQLVSTKEQFGEANRGDESQTREQYFFFRAAKNRALAELLDAENNLRWLLGLANSDRRMIMPSDEPISAVVDFDWWQAYDEALVQRPELRQERWELKKKELQLAHSRNGLLPRLDAVALYRWLGLGDELIAANRNGLNFPSPGSRAWEELTGGNYQEVSLGLEFGFPVGFRRELANVRNAQLKLAREKSRLEDMELDVQRELAMVYRAKDTNYELAEDHAARWIASTTEAEVQEAQYEAGQTTVDRLLDAQRRRAEAQVAYYQSLVEYNKAIALLHRRKGTSLEYCGVFFDEGPWPSKAYADADNEARRRSAARSINYGFTRPGVVSTTGQPDQMWEGEVIYEDGMVPTESDMSPGLPTPAPLPALPMPDNSPEPDSGLEVTPATTQNLRPGKLESAGRVQLTGTTERPLDHRAPANRLRITDQVQPASYDE